MTDENTESDWSETMSNNPKLNPEQALRVAARVGMALSLGFVILFIAHGSWTLATVMVAPVLFFYFTVRNATEIITRVEE